MIRLNLEINGLLSTNLHSALGLMVISLSLQFWRKMDIDPDLWLNEALMSDCQTLRKLKLSLFGYIKGSS